MESTKQKITDKVKELIATAEERGRAHFEVCDAYYYGWDRDLYLHHARMVEAIRKAGYEVSVQTRHGVIDIDIVKPIKIEL